MKPLPRILLVEDEHSLRSAVEQTLLTHNFSVITASSGTEAVKLFKKHKPDLVLLDLILPEKSGFAVLEELRVTLQSKTPVIVLSNLDRPEDMATGKHLGANSYLLKSNTSLKEIVQAVHNALQPRTSPA